MNLVMIIIWVALAFLIAATLALFTIGASEIFLMADNRYRGYGVAAVLLCWFILLPIMVLVCIFVGLYKFVTANLSLLQNRRPGFF